MITNHEEYQGNQIKKIKNIDFAFPESSCARVRMEKVAYTGFYIPLRL